ncbi:MAG: SH3 domain-containing protein [Sphingorhabdus sp.]
MFGNDMKNLVKISVAALLLASSAGIAQSQKKTPYWASVKADEARMRTGPSTEFPIKWVYKRENLPVKVVAVHSIWRKIEDPDGDQGWMHVSLLSPSRTAMVLGTSVAALRESPVATSRISWRVEPGVVGQISECDKGWCRFDNKGRAGYIEAGRLYGDEAP